MIKKTILLAACALLASACASTGMRAGMVERDGSWYSPAHDGYGDYYTDFEADYARDWPWDFRVGLVSRGGYCPARYRYCTSLWDPFFGAAWHYGYYSPYYDPFYDPYWYQPWLYYAPLPHDHVADSGPPPAAGPVRPRPRVTGADTPARPPRAQPRPWQERPQPRRAGSPRPRPLPGLLGDGTK